MRRVFAHCFSFRRRSRSAMTSTMSPSMASTSAKLPSPGLGTAVGDDRVGVIGIVDHDVTTLAAMYSAPSQGPARSAGGMSLRSKPDRGVLKSTCRRGRQSTGWRLLLQKRLNPTTAQEPHSARSSGNWVYDVRGIRLPTLLAARKFRGGRHLANGRREMSYDVQAEGLNGVSDLTVISADSWLTATQNAPILRVDATTNQVTVNLTALECFGSGAGVGVVGTGAAGPGVQGESQKNDGVFGKSSSDAAGVRGECDTGFGVFGKSAVVGFPPLFRDNGAATLLHRPERLVARHRSQ
jgi:hypothetical protein